MFVRSQTWGNSPINHGADLVVFHEKYSEPKQAKIISAIAWLAWLVGVGTGARALRWSRFADRCSAPSILVSIFTFDTPIHSPLTKAISQADILSIIVYLDSEVIIAV